MKALLLAIVKGTKLVLTKLAPVAKTAIIGMTKFFKTHPKVASYVAGAITSGGLRAAADLIEAIKSSKQDVDEATISQLQAWAANVDQLDAAQVKEVLSKGVNKLKPSNTPRFYFNGKTISVFDEKNSTISSAPFLTDMDVKNFTMTWHIADDNIVNLWPLRVREMLETSYLSYYKRLSMDAPNSSTAISDMIKIVYLSWMAAAGLVASWRRSSAWDLRIDGSNAKACGLLGMSSSVLKQAGQEAKTEGLLLAGYNPNVSPDTTFNGVVEYDVVPDEPGTLHGSNLQSTLQADPFYSRTDTMSNALWTEWVSRVKSCMLSKRTIDWCIDHFGCIFVDNTGEDKRSAYVFHPWLGDALKSDIVSAEKGNSADYYSWSLSMCQQVRALLDKDKAYGPLLTLLGLSSTVYKPTNESERWVDLPEYSFKRDMAGQTLVIKECDDGLYEAFANANYATCYYQSYDGVMQSANAIRICKDSNPLAGYVAFKQPYKLEVGAFSNLEPTAFAADAGEVARATKFSGQIGLALGYKLEYSEIGGAHWNVRRPGQMFTPTVFENLNPQNNTPSFNMKQLTVANMSEIVGLSAVPALPNEEVIVAHFTSSLTTYSLLKMTYIPSDAFQECRIKDIETVTDYMYVNMLMNYESLKQLQERLDKIDEFYAINA